MLALNERRYKETNFKSRLRTLEIAVWIYLVQTTTLIPWVRRLRTNLLTSNYNMNVGFPISKKPIFYKASYHMYSYFHCKSFLSLVASLTRRADSKHCHGRQQCICKIHAQRGEHSDIGEEMTQVQLLSRSD